MGEARRRGTYEERKAQAIAGKGADKARRALVNDHNAAARKAALAKKKEK